MTNANATIFLSYSPDAATAIHWARRADGRWFTRISPNLKTPVWSNWKPSGKPSPDTVLGNTGRTVRLPH